MSNIAENICEAINIISTEKLNGLSYDKTVVCTIIDDSKRDKGIYIVKEDAASYTAYSENTTYRKNNQVYVTIPGNNYNNQKIIVGKKVSEKNEPVIYDTPFDTLVDIVGLDIQIPEKVPGLTANDPNTISVNIYSGNFYDAPYYGFSRLGIQADFKAWLREYNCVFGSYGLKITVDFIADEKIITDENGKETKTTDVTRRILYLNENDMVGNPYQFEDFYTQEKVFDISDYGGIAAISIDFYQDAGSFKMNRKDDDDNFIPVPYIDELGNKLFNNLFVYNWDIAIGYDISSYDTDVAKLYCL